MLKSFQLWLKDIPLADRLQREQSVVLQAFLFILIAATILGGLSSLTAVAASDRQLVGASTSLLLGLLSSGAIVMLRRGRFTAASVLTIVSLLAMAAVNMVPTGLEGSRAVFTLLALPIVLAGLLGHGRLLLLALILSVLVVVGVTVLGVTAPMLVGYSVQTYDPTLTCVTFVLAACVLALLVSRFGQALQTALRHARDREQELEQLRNSLEVTVFQRTAALQQAIEDIGQREASLARTLAELRASEAAVRELSAPVIPVLPGVLVAPLIGTLDSARTAMLSDNVLGMIVRVGAHHVIFDITGVPFVDTQGARVLLATASAIQLLGASTALVGIRPEVAQTIIALGLDLAVIDTYPSLQEAVHAMLVRSSDHTGAAIAQGEYVPSFANTNRNGARY